MIGTIIKGLWSFNEGNIFNIWYKSCYLLLKLALFSWMWELRLSSMSFCKWISVFNDDHNIMSSLISCNHFFNQTHYFGLENVSWPYSQWIAQTIFTISATAVVDSN